MSPLKPETARDPLLRLRTPDIAEIAGRHTTDHTGNSHSRPGVYVHCDVCDLLAEVERLTGAPAERRTHDKPSGLVHRALYDQMKSERDEARRTALAANVVGPWAWMPGGENDLASMGEDMVVTMTAGVLRGLLADAAVLAERDESVKNLEPESTYEGEHLKALLVAGALPNGREDLREQIVTYIDQQQRSDREARSKIEQARRGVEAARDTVWSVQQETLDALRVSIRAGEAGYANSVILVNATQALRDHFFPRGAQHPTPSAPAENAQSTEDWIAQKSAPARGRESTTPAEALAFATMALEQGHVACAQINAEYAAEVLGESADGDVLRALLEGEATLDTIAEVRGMAERFTSCPACGSEPWVNIDCKVCSVMRALPEPFPDPASIAVPVLPTDADAPPPDAPHERLNGPIHEWFSLSRCTHLVMPRTLLQGMPVAWQRKLTDLLREFDEAVRASGVDMPESYAVSARGKDGKLYTDPLPHYRHAKILLGEKASK